MKWMKVKQSRILSTHYEERSLALGLALVMVLGLTLLASPAAQAQRELSNLAVAEDSGPQLTQLWDLPTAGPPTTDVRLQGTGFDPLTAIDIYFDNTVVTATMTDASGSFGSGVVTVNGPALTHLQVPPTAQPGQHTITAQEHVGQKSAQKPFLVRTNWARFNFNLENTGTNPYENVLGTDNVADLAFRWRNCATTYLWASPAVVDGAVYVGGWDGSICAIDAATGTLLWKIPTQNQAGPPAVVNGVVYVGSDSVYALKASTGDVIWKYNEGADDFMSCPAVVNGVVYIGDIFRDYLYALDAGTGLAIWKYPTGGAIWGSPAVADGVVYIGSGDSKVYALNATTGEMVWQYATQGSVVSSPAVNDGVVYIGSFDNNVYALNAQTGAPIWKYTTTSGHGIESSPAVADGIVYIGGSSYGNADIEALDAKTGALVWKITANTAVHASPVVANGVVYIGSEGPGEAFYALDAKTGATLWSLPGEILASAAVADGVVYIPNGGAVSAYALPTQQTSETSGQPQKP